MEESACFVLHESDVTRLESLLSSVQLRGLQGLESEMVVAELRNRTPVVSTATAGTPSRILLPSDDHAIAIIVHYSCADHPQGLP